MHDGVNPHGTLPEAESQSRSLLRAMERKDQRLLFLPIFVIVVLAGGLILSDRSFWDSRFSFREGAADELGFLTLNLVLYIVFRHRQIRKLYSKLLNETIRSETLGRRIDELRSILEVSSSVRSTDNLNSTIQVVVDNARTCLQGDFVSLHLRKNGLQELGPRAASPADELNGSLGSIPMGNGIAGSVCETGRPLILSGSSEVQARADEKEGLASMDSVLSVPLLHGATNLGTLTIGKAEQNSVPFCLADLQLLIIFADYAAYVIQSAELHEEIRERENQLRQSKDSLQRARKHMSEVEKLPTVERMVSRLGHDLANPLTSITGYSQLLQNATLSPKHMDYVNNILGQTKRCQDIVEGFLAFIRGDGRGRFSCTLNQIVQQALQLRESIHESKEIRVQCEFDSNLANVSGNSFLLQEAFLHLLHNAEEALEEVPENRSIRVLTRQTQSGICILVEDSGPGIPEEISDRVFEPFFSTRDAGHHSGLGLSVATKIFEDHGGKLRLDSQTGHGARFVVEFPMVQDAPKPIQATIRGGMEDLEETRRLAPPRAGIASS